MKVPFVDLQAQYRSIEGEIKESAERVLQKADYILGGELDAFESEFARYCGTKYAIGVDTGTSALELTLRAFDIGEGDEVVTTANTFIATAFAISYTGAKPVFIDIDPQTYNIDIDALERTITPRTKAIIPVHLYGQPADMDPIIEMARDHNLVVIEDACQAHGASYKGRRAGCLGNAAAFSFFPAKNLGACGDGGAVVTNDESIADRLRMLRNYGQRQKYHHLMLGHNRRLDTLQAAILSVKLKKLNEWNDLRRKNAKLYSDLLSESRVVMPWEAPFARHVYHLYVIRVKNREKLQEYLHAKEISTGIHYPIPVHLQKAYTNLSYKQGDFPVTEAYSSEILSLPMYPELDEEKIRYVVDNLKSFAQGVD